MRILAPFILTFFAKKMQDKFNDQFNHQTNNSSKREGDVTIESKNKSSHPKDHNVGDYVDFEEVDE
tara:strand:- start:1782 stop:1979 length:198 start_codon:yes stop_codon:yes gene_type:complete